MSLRAMEAGYVPPHDDHGAGQTLFPQFEDIDQQNESYMVGMWTFLVQEIMFFGALFLAYSIYRTLYFSAYLDAHHFLNVIYGTINTGVLLTSSFSMVMAVYFHQHRNKVATIGCLVFTILCSFGFLGIKYVEYSSKINEGLFPGYGWNYTKALEHLAHEEAEKGGAAKAEGHGGAAASPEGAAAEAYFENKPVEGMNNFAGTVPVTVAAPAISAAEQKEETRGRHARLFFSIYFAMTGLHGVHVLVGIILMVLIIVFLLMDHHWVKDYMPTEMVGLYWHFVDIVWIFLFPLMYLIS